MNTVITQTLDPQLKSEYLAKLRDLIEIARINETRGSLVTEEEPFANWMVNPSEVEMDLTAQEVLKELRKEGYWIWTAYDEDKGGCYGMGITSKKR